MGQQLFPITHYQQTSPKIYVPPFIGFFIRQTVPPTKHKKNGFEVKIPLPSGIDLDSAKYTSTENDKCEEPKYTNKVHNKHLERRFDLWRRGKVK